MSDKASQARTAILKVLSELEGHPAGAARISERLASCGVTLQPRTVRFYLLQLDREGLTSFISRRKGRMITPAGREELGRANVLEKVGFVQAKVDTLSYRMSLNVESGDGELITNVALLKNQDISRAFAELKPVFERNLGMGDRLCIVPSSASFAGHTIPGGYTGIGTICSVTLNGVLLAAGIPITSRFGGLVEMRSNRPVRFTELIEYAGTTADPLEMYIRAGMTRVRECVKTGNGIIGASFREIPSLAMDQASLIFKKMEKLDLGGVLTIGRPGQPLLDVPVAEGRTGFVVMGGLNPIAAIMEAGIACTFGSLSGLEPYTRFA
ncbi:MAG: NrpR regulatory domain-containing protein, partial [Kiritimatiellae bacterium]|nr:NrpR regulatory domain-containing protein [Kiritimatiellia bacterium]